MSVPFALPAVSSARRRRWLITVIIVMVLVSEPFIRIIGAYTDAAAFVAFVLGVMRCSSEVPHHNNNHPAEQ